MGSQMGELRFGPHDQDLSLEFSNALTTAFFDSSSPSDRRFRPQLVTNSKGTGIDLLSVIQRQLRSSDRFAFCIAFISDEAIQMLVEMLMELAERGIRGKLLTSTYLNFNSPAALRKLLEFDNLDARVYQGNMHAKAYVFNHGDASTFIVGSSNLTASALTCNKEWNIVLHSFEHGELLERIKTEFEELWESDDSACLTEDWIRRYEGYRAHRAGTVAASRSFNAGGRGREGKVSPSEAISPNAMQRSALKELAKLHKSETPRALLISATGTGKTYLSAFDVEATHPGRVLFLAHRQRILDASMKSYRKLLGGRYTYGIYKPGMKKGDEPTCMFAMVTSMARHLSDFFPAEFDYIVIDEAHRVGSSGYRNILSYFKPRFCLGMTATPNRTDGYDVFAMFDHVIAYQITLQDALANDMLVPFHYFGIADLRIDYDSQDDLTLFNKLTSDARVEHVIQKIERYSVEKENRRGLIFCSRIDEALELSTKFNRLGYRTAALSGRDSEEERNRTISRLEAGEIQYIFSVDILNEGVDIPSVNQIIMLRATESAIVFVQQLGRGLRKDDGKDYTLVLDFIGNYQKNFLVPVALSGDKTYNKDRLRRIVKEGSAVIPGRSTVSFDRISEARIYRAIDGGNFTSIKFLRNEYDSLRRTLGRIPSLLDFDEHGSIDPLLIFQKMGSYHAFLSKYEKGYDVHFTEDQCEILKFISMRLAAGKRAEDLLMLRELIEDCGDGETVAPISASGSSMERVFGRPVAAERLRSVENVLSGSFFAPDGFVPLVVASEGGVALSDRFSEALGDHEFKSQVRSLIEFGLHRNRLAYRETYRDTSFVLNAKYTYEEICRLLNWRANVNAQNIGGYKYDRETNTFPVFINYDKSPDISESIQYEDRFVSENELVAISKQPRTLESPEILRLKSWGSNGMKVYLFMRKNKDDKESKEFYFLGEMQPTGRFEPILMPIDEGNRSKPAVEITYRLCDPVRNDIYEFMLSDLGDGDEG